MKTKPPTFPERSMSWVSRHLVEAAGLASRHGWVVILQDGKVAAYLISPKVWKTWPLSSDSIVALTKRAKVVAYIVPKAFWEFGAGFLASFTTAGRRRLPALAKAAAQYDLQQWRKENHLAATSNTTRKI